MNDPTFYIEGLQNILEERNDIISALREEVAARNKDIEHLKSLLAEALEAMKENAELIASHVEEAEAHKNKMLSLRDELSSRVDGRALEELLALPYPAAPQWIKVTTVVEEDTKMTKNWLQTQGVNFSQLFLEETKEE